MERILFVHEDGHGEVHFTGVANSSEILCCGDLIDEWDVATEHGAWITEIVPDSAVTCQQCLAIVDAAKDIELNSAEWAQI